MNEYLEMMIKTFGFEDPRTISIAIMIENNVDRETIKNTVEGLIKMAPF